MDNATGSLAPAVCTQGLISPGQDDARNLILFDISIEIPSGQFLVMTGPENRVRRRPC